MRSVRLRKAGVCGAVVGASFGGALLIAGQTAAQGPQNGSSSAGAASAKTVTITGTSPSDYSFQPRKLKVKAGAHVTWSWQSNAPHNVVFSKSGKHSPTGQSETYNVRFKHAGVFQYTCTIHGFTGKIVVH